MPTSVVVVNVEPFETRVALVEEGIISEILIERPSQRGVVGNVYHGKVSRVLRGMQAAFVDIGLERQAFLQVSDTLHPEDLEAFGPVDTGPEEVQAPRRVSKWTPIGKVLQAGQPVIVQVTRAPMGKKGPRATSHVSLPGRHLVFLPTVDHIGISRRIAEEKERRRLRTVVEELRSFGGFIVRTVAENASEETLRADIDYLTKLWNDIFERKGKQQPPALLYEDLDLVLRSVRDLFASDVEQFVVDDRATFTRVSRFMEKFLPERRDQLVLYEGEEPIFDAFGIEEEIQRALSRVIPLPSGGSLFIDQTEALTAIDVNTGRFVGGRDHEETITKTNLEAVKEVTYQLRLRNIGGLIVVDFIDMDRPSNREKVNRALRDALREDRARTSAVRISEFGLVEMTRKGSHGSLARQLYEPCTYCDGTGHLKSRVTVCCDLLRELRRKLLETRTPTMVVECHKDVAELLSGEHAQAVSALATRFGRKIEIRPKEGLHLEAFTIKGGRKHGGQETS